ncbi:uncharacterized protein LOC125386434 isoform X1 [Bombus terrestris]|uniref:Uncharacterized protein LOC125386434 isoform X1 n=1 Tax=Bombus terrestris TaxID=30195 RepID=A0A9C6WDU3_BOMTE|nr:uncharacterized protein LOC125386434 isoform X1 [Bombus terrestris]
MCDHCAKVTSQKGYAGQVTCKCDHGEKKNGEAKEKDFGGCCSKKEKKTIGGCCGAKCCAGPQEEGGCCTSPPPKEKLCCGQEN